MLRWTQTCPHEHFTPSPRGAPAVLRLPVCTISAATGRACEIPHRACARILLSRAKDLFWQASLQGETEISEKPTYKAASEIREARSRASVSSMKACCRRNSFTRAVNDVSVLSNRRCRYRGEMPLAVGHRRQAEFRVPKARRDMIQHRDATRGRDRARRGRQCAGG
jgi:hypothetical protein